MTIPPTINTDMLMKLPAYHRPPSYQFGSAGSDCFMKPPGHPTYFVRSIYTAHGNEPRQRGTNITMELLGRAVAHNGAYFLWLMPDLDCLYLPLPWGHERVERWLDLVYSHLRHTYYDNHRLVIATTERTPYVFAAISKGIDGEPVINPASHQKGTMLKRLALRGLPATDRVLNSELAKIVTPENHAAHRFVQRWYPEAQPDLGRIAHPDNGVVNTSPTDRWWERHETPPIQ